MLEEFDFDIGRLIAKLVRILVYLCWDLLFQGLGWYLGWPVARLLTLGRWPKVGYEDKESASQGTQIGVSLIGWIFFLAVLTLTLRW